MAETLPPPANTPDSTAPLLPQQYEVAPVTLDEIENAAKSTIQTAAFGHEDELEALLRDPATNSPTERADILRRKEQARQTVQALEGWDEHEETFPAFVARSMNAEDVPADIEAANTWLDDQGSRRIEDVLLELRQEEAAQNAAETSTAAQVEADQDQAPTTDEILDAIETEAERLRATVSVAKSDRERDFASSKLKSIMSARRALDMWSARAQAQQPGQAAETFADFVRRSAAEGDTPALAASEWMETDQYNSALTEAMKRSRQENPGYEAEKEVAAPDPKAEAAQEAQAVDEARQAVKEAFGNTTQTPETPHDAALRQQAEKILEYVGTQSQRKALEAQQNRAIAALYEERGQGVYDGPANQEYKRTVEALHYQVLTVEQPEDIPKMFALLGLDSDVMKQKAQAGVRDFTDYIQKKSDPEFVLTYNLELYRNEQTHQLEAGLSMLGSARVPGT